VFDAPARARDATALELAWQPPLSAFAHFANEPGIAFFYSSGPVTFRSRYSYLCIDPISMLSAERGCVTIDGAPTSGTAFTALGDKLARHTRVPAPTPFTGGAAGYFGYEMAPALERLPRAPGHFTGVPDAQFGIYDLLFAWDHAEKRVWLIAPHADPFARVQRALAIWHNPPAEPPPPAPLRWRQAVSQATHQARIARALAYIRAGDIYQANITAPFIAPRGAQTAAQIFTALARKNPAPFSAYFATGDDCAVASVSPERFIRLSPAGTLETRPIKGTRPRGATPAADAAQAAALLASEKDRAENLMIVDLMRNDLSRVAIPGSVRVPALNALETFASVHHLVSTVTAQLRPGLGAIDVLRAAFPGGSITGAPKLRAMEIIAELEKAARGPYCGIAAWLGFDGAMDSSILIRTVTVARDCVVAQAGGGIVADSDPEAEWNELLVKITPMLRALGTASGEP
jgi:para-aminobenzoate synthetase component 1